MNQRIMEEMVVLKEKYPTLQYCEQYSWVLIPKFLLPLGRYNRSQTDLLFNIPVGYPNTGPDDFFVDGDLRLADSGNPPGFNAGSKSSSGSAQVKGNWGWFSWHPASWRPATAVLGGDNLLTFLRGVIMCLKGVETT